MPAYTKYSDRFRRTQGSTATPANPANPAQASPIGNANIQQEASALAALAGLAGPPPQRCNSREGPVVIAPQRFAGPLASLRPAGEPPYDHPHGRRCGRIIRNDGSFLHFCMICGAWGTYGYGITKDQTGRWYCHEHRLQGGRR
jgi:hypothetical protein